MTLKRGWKWDCWAYGCVKSPSDEFGSDSSDVEFRRIITDLSKQIDGMMFPNPG